MSANKGRLQTSMKKSRFGSNGNISQRPKSSPFIPPQTKEISASASMKSIESSMIALSISLSSYLTGNTKGLLDGH